MQSHDGHFEVEDSEDRNRHQNESRRQLTTQRKNERQDNGNRRRLALQHPRDLLRSLTHERDRRRTARRRLDSASSFAISNFPRARRKAHDAYAYT